MAIFLKINNAAKTKNYARYTVKAASAKKNNYLINIVLTGHFCFMKQFNFTK